jgi:hypothetical protein
MKITDITCTQCSSSDFDQEGETYLRCSHCLSLYSIDKPDSSAGVTIMKGANVTFGKDANVVISGGLEIQDGANVEINGNLTLLEKSSEEIIEAAKTKLKRVEGAE